MSLYNTLSNRWSLALSEFEKSLQESLSQKGKVSSLAQFEEKLNSGSEPLGWLINCIHGHVLSLEEGVNRFNLSQDLGLIRVFDGPKDEGYRIYVFENGLRIDEAWAEGVSRSYQTNEVIRLKESCWLIKLLPTDLRRGQR